MRSCKRCGGDIPPERPRSQWCSNNCRKRECDDKHRAACEDCGAALGPRSGWGNVVGSPRAYCGECWRVREADSHTERVEFVARLYNEGKTTREISAALGYGAASIPGMLLRDARRRGLIGYRNRGWDKEAA